MGSFVGIFNFFRRELEEADEFCSFCDNHFVIQAKESTIQPVITLEGDDPRLVRDHRMRQQELDMQALESLEAL